MTMKKINIRVASFNPLCYSKTGILGCNTGLKPFIDASCRREPDLENEYPSISAICRKGKFAPHLDKGNIIVYITNKGRYLADDDASYKLVAILEVIEKCENHQIGANWYQNRNLSLPSNCFVPDNLPLL